MSPDTRDRIASLIASERVFLFMKGNPQAPQCGFSATVVGILDQLLPGYGSFDVLSDMEVREGIKAFSDWPTIPQLYVDGEFLGGCDIVQEMYGSGELHQALGVVAPAAEPPQITITDAAAAALRPMIEQETQRVLHLKIDARFQAGLFFGPAEAGELRAESNGVTLHLDGLSAGRAAGLTLDAEETAQGPAFRVDNPNAPQVKPLTPAELQARRASGDAFELLDVRTPEERAQAAIEGSRLLDEALVRELEGLDRATPLVFHCHHGGRSQQAAEHFARLGFREVYNLVGGIDAWSQEIDPKVPRY